MGEILQLLYPSLNRELYTGAGVALFCKDADGGRGSSGISFGLLTAGIFHHVKVILRSAQRK